MARLKEISLLKGKENFVFRYEAGQEESVLDAFVDMANDRSSKFDWFDAAVLSFQLSKHLVEQADALLRPDRTSPRLGSEETQSPWSYL